MKVITTVAALALTASLVACAPATAPEGMMLASNDSREAQSCFYMNQVTGYSQADDNLLVTASLGRTFETTIIGGCPEMTPTANITIAPEKAVSSRLCGGDYARLTTHSRGEGNGQCRIRVVRLLTEDEAAAVTQKDGYRVGRISAQGH